MAGTLKKVTPGEPLSMRADTFNAFVDAAVAHRGRANSQNEPLRTRDTKSGIILVLNDTGADQDQFAVVGLDGIAISPSDNEPEFRSRVVLRCEVPAEFYHRGRFGILAEPIKQGDIGRAFVDDIAQVRLFVPPGTVECPFAEIEDATTLCLQATVFGSATILWREGGTGEQWAVVKIGRSPGVFPVKLVQSGGEQGDDKNPATWEYDVLDPFTQRQLLSQEDPTGGFHNWVRPAAGRMTPATFGHAHFTEEGDLSLGWINEMVEQEACQP